MIVGKTALPEAGDPARPASRAATADREPVGSDPHARRLQRRLRRGGRGRHGPARPRATTAAARPASQPPAAARRPQGRARPHSAGPTPARASSPATASSPARSPTPRRCSTCSRATNLVTRPGHRHRPRVIWSPPLPLARRLAGSRRTAGRARAEPTLGRRRASTRPVSRRPVTPRTLLASLGHHVEEFDRALVRSSTSTATSRRVRPRQRAARRWPAHGSRAASHRRRTSNR